MEIKLKPGKYVAAVSGGVDSMVLLDLLLQQDQSSVSRRQSPDDMRPETSDQRRATRDSNYEFVVAHFDHGIHAKSEEYCEFVAQAAASSKLKFVYERGRLGPDTSEASARDARYKFLNKVKDEHDADSILTAHHQDDVLETAIINMLRGSGRKGLSSLKSTTDVKRPLLAYSKKQIQDYATKHNIDWRDDPTNLDTSYLRNYVRRNILTKLDKQQKNKFLNIIKSQRKTNSALENIITKMLQENPHLDRKAFVGLPHNLAKEIIAELLRSNKIPFDSKLLERLVVFAKTARTGKQFAVSKNNYFEIQNNELKLICYN
ncbi:MAG TPA: tRNA lysidine(34) synthetase TilS [Candidatus Saccharimonadales bacterium]|nr:tRNA lysidine(34) synthetase TilS [Candidatus Saccharimonadales bacterium]